ncbi:US6A [Papio ursinus cytomegalovirus]|uniref:US6A n=1 Tax=Papiine betaherpesvirus 4 TaxID=2560624 RepID=A0A0F7CSU4_9BETA|nr:US6A [Papio ursinus cytomegalovirus]AKG51554.1 US6A [Papiine betaherpesvirus 4]
MLRYPWLQLLATFLLFEVSLCCFFSKKGLTTSYNRRFHYRWIQLNRYCKKEPVIPRMYHEFSNTCELKNDHLYASGIITGNFTDTAWLHVQIIQKRYDNLFFVLSTDAQHPPIIMDSKKYRYGIPPKALVSEAQWQNEFGITKEVRVENQRLFYYAFQLPAYEHDVHITMHIEPETKPLFIKCHPTYGLNWNPKLFKNYMIEMWLQFTYGFLGHIAMMAMAWIVMMLMFRYAWRLLYKDAMEHAARCRVLVKLHRERYRRIDHKVL